MNSSCSGACPVDITSTLVGSLVANQFPDWSQRLVRIVQPGGWDNRTFRLGDDLLVRIRPAKAGLDLRRRNRPILRQKRVDLAAVGRCTHPRAEVRARSTALPA